MVSFESIAIFILATTKTNGRHKQDYPTYFESRIVPIRETWGQYFPNLYFVFGTNKFDYDFLTQQCKLVEEEKVSQQGGKPVRNLLARTQQIASENVMHRYRCPIYGMESYYRSNKYSNITAVEGESSSILYEFNALWTGNCTGEYFGIGPTCRCQEAMRYFNYNPSLASVEWFAFMDDDIHFRPYSMLGLLDSLTNPARGQQATGKPASTLTALVSSNAYRSFEFSRKAGARTPINLQNTHGKGFSHNHTTSLHNCRNSSVYNFPIAQPAIINR
jgi:hypothetical protein